MNKSLIKSAHLFAWREIKKQPVSWAVLSLKSLLITFFLSIALMSFVVSFVTLFFMLAITSGSFFINPSWYLQIAYGAIIAIVSWVILVRIVSFKNIISVNTLDVASGSAMSQLSKRFISHALLISDFLVPMGFLSLSTVLISVTLFFTGSFYKNFHSSIHIGLLATFFVLALTFFFTVRFAFVRLVILDEHCGLRRAFLRSWQLTSGYKLEIACALLISLFIFIFPLLALINLFLPYTHLMKSYIYVLLKGDRK